MQTKKASFEGRIFSLDSKHNKHHCADKRASKLRWHGYVIRIKLKDNHYLVYKTKRRKR
jgi:hypothetical protein